MFKGVLQTPQALKEHNPLLLHHDGDFHLIQKGKHSKIPFANIKGFKKKLTLKQFKGFLENGGYFWLSKNDQDDYFVEAKMRGLGGGPIGASVGVVAGAALVQGAYNGALGGLGMVLTPFVSPVGAVAIVGTVRWATWPAALLATKTAALAGGIALGVATGPF